MDIFLQAVIAFSIGAIIVESLTKIIVERFKKIDPTILSIIIGVVVAFYSKFNILAIVGIEYGWNGSEVMEYVGLAIGIVFSGFVLSRGSNFVHDLFSQVKSAKELTQAQAEVRKLEAEFAQLPTDIDEDLRD
jgi:hypothetical protein